MNGVGQTEIRPRARARRESSPTYYICHAELTTIFTTERYGAHTLVDKKTSEGSAPLRDYSRFG